MTFIDVWIGYAIFGVTAFSLVFVWAVRARQFSNLDRGRYIPLDADQTAQDSSDRAGRADKWGLRIMVIIAAAMLLAAVIVAIRNA